MQGGGKRQLISLTRRERKSILATCDGVIWFTAAAIAVSQSPDRGVTDFLIVGLLVAAIAIAANSVLKVYSTRWQVGEFRHVRANAIAGAVPFLGLALACTLLGLGTSLMTVVGASALAIASGAVLRGIWRTYIDWSEERAAGDGTPVIVFGAGDGGRRIVDALTKDPASQISPVAILDDDPTLHGREIGGLTVLGGRELLESTARETDAEVLLAAIPSADRDLLRELERLAASCGLSTSVLPSMAQLVNDRIRPTDIRELTPADLLGRKPVDMDLPRLGAYVTGKTVLVTGAGGSIGSELCRQLHRLGPEAVLMLDRDESALHALQLSIDGRAQLDSEHLIVADIRERDRLAKIFDRWQPDVVFHAAALKHLPLLELHPDEGLKTNVVGSYNVASLAAEHGVGRFVNVSTDKAADPTSVLGWTKHLAERLTTRVGIDNDLPYLSVRFGNVLGSRGSVLTAFVKQIADGGPVTVTHPEVTRYFMTVEEASSLVIAAGALGGTGDVMILEMGEPVAILDVARELITRSGEDIDISFTGLRHGEKIHETLQGGDEIIVRTDDGLMWRGVSEPIDWLTIEPLVDMEDADDLVRELERLGGTAKPGSGPDILLSPPEVGDAERTALINALESGWIAPAGPELSAFERDLEAYTGAESVLAVSSGTAALHLALLVLGVQPDDEVVVQTTTFAASAFAVCHAGAQPVFCDVDQHTGMMDPDRLNDYLIAGARRGRLPAAVMPVDLYGLCANYERILEVCAPFGVPVVQDAAEALGAVSQGRPAATHGQLAAISFNGNKIITTSGGGALAGPPDLIAKAAKLASQAKEPVPHYEHLTVGYNYRMSNLLAALGRVQLANLDERIEARRRVRDAYRRALPDLDWIPEGVTEQPNNWLNVALLPDHIDPAMAVATLLDKGIEARRSWKPMHMQPVFSGAESIGGEIAEGFYARGLCLPSSQALRPDQIDRVADAVSLAVVETMDTLSITGD